jgi:hypothetical protein
MFEPYRTAVDRSGVREPSRRNLLGMKREKEKNDLLKNQSKSAKCDIWTAKCDSWPTMASGQQKVTFGHRQETAARTLRF